MTAKPRIPVLTLIFVAIFLFVPRAVLAEETFVLPEKLPPHPRLFFTAEREKELKEQRKTDAFLDRQITELLKKADRVLKEPVTDYRIPDAKRLLGQSRRSIDRTTALAFAYRMTGKEEYARAAVAELLAVCAFKDWNPSHYLDTAEMATAVGLGYDWLYDFLSETEREEIRNGIVRHAFNSALPLYKNQAWWVKGNNNWNEVCNAGLLLAALALADVERVKSEKIVGAAIESLPRGLRFYAPDGAYPEGPGYWAYGGTYSGLMIMALRDVLGSDFGLLETDGLDTTGDYYMHVIGPNDRCFNYADGGDGVEATPFMYALARCFDRPDYSVWQRRFIERANRWSAGRFAVLNAVWYDPRGTDADLAGIALGRKFQGVQDIMMMRTVWDGPNAAFVGFKAGNNRASHGHLDIGSFIYEVNGIRWAVDLGTDDYNLPGYFGKQRWDYYRLNNRSHNTLVIGDKLQNTAADCKLDFSTGKELGDETVIGRAVADITQAYAGQVSKAVRSATLFKDGTLVVEDSLEGVKESVRWGMMTGADIKGENANKVRLEQKGQTLEATVESEQVERGFEIVSAAPPTEKERQNKGFSMLAAFTNPDKDGKVAVRVTLKPVK